MGKKPELKRFNLNIPVELHTYLKETAEELNVSMAGLTTIALEEWRKQRVMAYSMEEMINVMKMSVENERSKDDEGESVE
ncbi:hypothetical protein LPB41_34465 [Thalassospira sp. MA62]|nr:hypothetical protein [Thalassospira sp. MA62]